MRYAPDAEEIERLARAAIAAMPPVFREHLLELPIFVEDFAEQSVLEDLGIEDPWELSGLYEGRPLTQESIWASGEFPSRIRLYRRPLLDEWVDTGVSLEDLITHVLVHEVGHHFGFSDEDMHAIEEGMRES
ncbi:MAG: metallopeptidase family protein [Sphingomonadales bacterium]|nr:metallopeptidase family protein [Sphingomonadales bacterium]